MSADGAMPDSLAGLLGARELVETCVHCGYCLPTCPTYALWAQETDSPRGRIVLIDEAISAGGRISEEMVAHFDSCLGCLACVSSCPSGVRYDELIELVRPEVERQHVRPPAERALRRTMFETIPHPARMRALSPALAVSKRLGTGFLPGRLGTMVRVAPRPPSRPEGIMRTRLRAALPRRAGPPAGRVALLLGCVQRVFFPDVHRASIGVLAAEGFEVLTPAAPECCGALELHAGELDAARARAGAAVAAFAQLGALDRVVVNAAGCGAAMKRYGELLGTPQARAFSDRVCDISELLADVETRVTRTPLPLRVVYHDACHLRHAQQIREQPRAMLRAIPGLELLEVADEADICCGSAGTYNLLQPEPAAALGARKARLLLDTGAEAIATGNPGCAAQLAMHVGSLGTQLPVHHPIELLWRSIQGSPD
ncbi:MAG: (Fe-S)-binding protein [Solirubrobacteraceae bacterium]